ncbi:Abortive infection C-terminus [Alkalibacterium putridalgicola]|uniref:Abortive infection C-terminus n=1 Tax=Alkalibacterium putridalgicola TaxID=426703 RepID=A0A1H7WVB9_9LACT|nr:abortive infection family protein [Alkalibacterium putridalgicola]GEK90234.1 hypothetical protein APU01nite_22730 [Alkalibacterium putridalgicola]SEM25225.1 Abortive infection C-terminus [Alkalibacterium putridalgicola]
MIIQKSTLKNIAMTITGDNDLSPYRSGPELIDFFNNYGFNDIYDKHFPTRWIYALEKIETITQNNKFTNFINYALSEIHYVEVNEVEHGIQDKIIKYWNKYLKFDEYKIVRNQNTFSLTSLKTSQVILQERQLDILSTEFLLEQIDKCNTKLSIGDFDGAITNARSLVEEVLLEIEERIEGKRGKNDGNIDNLYKRVKKIINFDPTQKGLNDSLKQILSGLNSIVIGVGKIRSKASDSHSRQYRPSEHHARLAVNAAHTFTSFIIDSYHYQTDKRRDVT